MEPGTFQQLQRLFRLQLSSNKITTLDGLFSDIATLNYVLLQENPLSELRYEHVRNLTGLLTLFACPIALNGHLSRLTELSRTATLLRWTMTL